MPHLVEFYRACVCVYIYIYICNCGRSINIKNEAVWGQVGLLRQKRNIAQKPVYNTPVPQYFFQSSLSLFACRSYERQFAASIPLKFTLCSNQHK
jgi:hypothetical protein